MKSKMQLCMDLYAEITTPGYNLNGQSPRSVFVTRCVAENGMTKNGANTYYQNIAMQQKANGFAVGQQVGRGVRAAPMGQTASIAPQPIDTSATPILTTPGLNEPRPLVLVLEVGRLAFSAAGSGKIVIDTLNRVLVNNARLLSANETSTDGDRPNVLTVEIDAEITMGAFKAGKQVIENLNRVLGDRAAKLLAASEKY